jgi:glycerol kinase
MDKKYILAIDQGTTSSRALIFDKDFNIVGTEQEETTHIFPKKLWVEQDAGEIWETQLFVARKLISRLGINSGEIKAAGVTNQRETTVIWDKNTGKPVYNAIIWQDKRTAEYCNEIRNSDEGRYIAKASGLVIDSYFSATKIHWILNNVVGAAKKAKNGDLLFGTIDTWLIWNLTGGELHITDYSNASRTLLYNIRELKWDNKILDFFGIPESMLPKVCESSAVYGNIKAGILGTESVKLGGIAGDQQAALFGHQCLEPGTVKNTYGTGCFILMNTGEKIVESKSGLLTTIAWGIDGKISYALEGSVFIAGAVIQWLRDELKMLKKASDSEQIATELPDNGGVYIVPAFAGIGAPYWNMDAKGIICGLTRSTDYRHIVRAGLEAMAYQTRDVLMAMKNDSQIDLEIMNVDGGAAQNNFLMQFQADLLRIDLLRPEITESTALGAAFLAAISSGFCNIEELKQKRKIQQVFLPGDNSKNSEKLYSEWKNAVRMALGR